MKKEERINQSKEIVAKVNGYQSDIMGSAWEFAMRLNHRTKKQILLYEQLCEELIKNH